MGSPVSKALKGNGKLDVGGFDHPVHLMEVPAIQKDFRLRNRDIQEFQALAAISKSDGWRILEISDASY